MGGDFGNECLLFSSYHNIFVASSLLFLHLLPLPPPPAQLKMVYEATASAPVNIACIKYVYLPLTYNQRSLTHIFSRYWGKRDTRLILPTNSSLSVTLDQDHLRSTTTSRADASFEAGDRLWLNGKEEVIKEGGRLAVCIKELRGWRKEMEDKEKDLPKVGFLFYSCNMEKWRRSLC